MLRFPVLLSLISLIAFGLPGIQADEKEEQRKETARIMAKYRRNIQRGLRWLAKQQEADGHWEAGRGRYPVAMTALASMALMAEGSTPRQGKYAKNLEKSVDYLLRHVQRNGLISDPRDPQQRQRYMYGHGFSLMYLAQVYGEEVDKSRRVKLRKVLERAVDFTAKAQTNLGGWGYVSARDGSNFDEGSVTITQVQALRAAKNAGISVPKKTIDKAQEYLKKSTYIQSRNKDAKKEVGGVIYSLQRGGTRVRTPLTAAGIACMFNAGQYGNELAVKWLNHCQKNIPISNVTNRRFGHWEYTHYYYAQVMYVLGEDRHAKLRPDLPEKDLLKWSEYRKKMFAHLASRQSNNGSWTQGSVGPVYVTSLFLTIMQLDKGNLPIYQR